MIYEPVAAVVVHCCCKRAILNTQESIQLAPTISPVPTCCDAGAKWECTLVNNEMNIVRWRPRKVGIRRCCSICRDGMWCFDDFNIKAASERLKVGNDQLLIWWWTS